MLFRSVSQSRYQKEEAEKLNPNLRENSSKRYLPITGKANWVIDQKKKIGGHLNPVSLGRFGWKASSPSVEQQTLGALRGDLGVTNYLFKEENIHGTSALEKYKSEFPQKFHENSNKTEASDEVAADLVFYSQTLAVPSRRGLNQEDVLAGMKYFNELKCAQCHQPIQKTGNHSISILENQKIYPFTDLLLHDMGEGLADHRSDFLANGREWRTPPLWGIGHTKVVNPMAGFLHDGRARTLEEALSWPVS